MKHIDNIKESLARILVFVMVFMQVVGNGNVLPVFAEAFTQEYDKDLVASASNAIQNGKVSLRSTEEKDLELMVQSESPRYESGDLMYLDVYLKNNSSEPITDGVLKFSGKGIIKESGYFEDFQDSSSGFGPGMSDTEDDEDSEDEESEDVETISEDGKLSNITLKPNSVYHVGFYCALDDVENVKGSDITFRFRGEQDKKSVSISENFDYTIGGMNLMPVELEDELIEGEEYILGLDFDLGSQFEEIIDDKMLEDEAEKEEEETEKETEKATEAEKEEESTQEESSESLENSDKETESSDKETESETEESIESSKDSDDKKDNEEEVLEADSEDNSDGTDEESDSTKDNELSIEKVERNLVKSSLKDEEEKEEDAVASEIKDSQENKENDSEEETEESISDESSTSSEDESTSENESKSSEESEESTDPSKSVIEDETNASGDTNNIDETKADLASPADVDLNKDTSNIKKDDESSKNDKVDKDKVATPSNAYVKWDSEDINKGEKPIIKDIKCEIETFGIELDDFEVVDAESDLNTKLNIKFKVKEDQKPGVYFGRVSATYKYKNRTFKTSQGFMINLSGEVIDLDEEITLVGYLDNTEVSVTGPRRSFPLADELELSVSEVETEKQELVDNALNEKKDELGVEVSGLKAIDIKVIADGEYKELNGDVTVNFKNADLQEVYESLEFTEDELNAISKVNDMEEDSEESEDLEVKTLDLSECSSELSENTSSLEVTEDTKVYHLDEEVETLTEMNTQLTDDGDIEMETNHFSIYIIVNFETVGINVDVTHWANVKDFTLENGGLEDIRAEEFITNHIDEFDRRVRDVSGQTGDRNPEVINNPNLISLRLRELKYRNDFKDIDTLNEDIIFKDNKEIKDRPELTQVSNKLYPGKIETDHGLDYPTIYTQIYSKDTYLLPGWATKGIPYTMLLDKLSKLNNEDLKENLNYKIDTITFITASSKEEADKGNKKEVKFKKVGDSYDIISGIVQNPPLDKLPDGINEDDKLLELDKYNEVKFDYIETEGNSKVDVAFHDYNLGDIFVNKSGDKEDYGWQSKLDLKFFNGINAPIVYTKDENGDIHSTIEYGDKTGRIYIGGGSLNSGFSPFSNIKDTDLMNKNFNNPVVDSVKTLIDIEDYNIFKGTLRDPGLFYPGNLYSKYTYEKEGIEKEIVANEYIPGYKLEFKRLGDTHVISKVLDPSDNEILSNLDTLIYTGPKYGLDYPLYSNLFWPLDEHAAQEGSCSDMLKPLGKALTSASGGSLDFDPNDEDKVIGETTRHNWLFGMNFSLKFNTKEYIGPLNYYFRGDDDLFVYVDGHLMVDIGGIHSSYGSFVDVKQWLVKEHLAELNEATGELIPLVDGEKDPDHEYTMSVFYTERGGTGSCCYMQYTLPKVKPIEVPIPDTITHTVNKRWNDGNNIGNARPENLAMQIYRNNEPYGELMYIGNSESVDDNQTWRHTWNNLPAFDGNGEKYVYEVREINVDTDEYIQTENKHNTNNTNLINTSKSDSISVSKAWSDNTPMNQRTPIKVGLYKYSYKIGISDSEADAGEGEESGDSELGESTDEPSGSTDETDEPSSSNPDDSQETESVVENELTRSDLTPEMIEKLELVSFEGLNYCQDIEPIIELSSTNSSYSWDNLPAYENDGRKILYVPFEVEVDDKGIVNRIDEGHTTSDEKFVVNYDGNNHITNNYNLMALAANKTWAVQNELDKDIENTIRPEIGVQLYQNGYTYGKSVILNEANNWTCEFTDVPRVSEDGTEYNYTVKETYQGSTVTDDTITVDNKYQYQVTYTESGNLLTVNNILKEVKRANFTVKKEWKDEEGAINKETSIDIGLFRDGELYEKVTLNEENGWQHSWNNMELNKDLDTQYSYSIYELNGDTKLEDDTDVRFNGVDKYKVQYKTENGLTVITNTFQEIPKINLLVQKGWNDGEQKRHNDMSYGPELNCRPTFIKIQLYQDGAAFGEPVRMTGDRYIEDEPWTYRFKDLPKYHVVNGEEVDYVYTVKELNTNGEPMDSKDTCRFNGSDKYIVRYGTSGLLGQETATNKIITNSRVPDPVKNLVIEKQWLNNDNPEGSEVTEIGVRIYRTNADGVRTVYRNAVILTKANGWKATISNVPAEDKQDRPYTYSIVELSKPAVDGDELAKGATFRFNGVDKYVVDYTSDGDKLKVSNTYVNPPLTKVKITKTWAGEGESVDKRPSEVYVKLYRTVDDVLKEQVGNIVTITPDANGIYSYTWNDLKAHNLNDEAYTFSVVECLVNGNDIENGTTVRLEGKDRDKYTVTYGDGSYNDTENMWSFGITNTYVEPIREEFIVRKKWTGATTPPNVEIEAGIYRSDTNLAGMKLYKTVKLNASNNWEARVMVENYNNYDVGYVYEVKEFLNGQPLKNNSTIKLENKKYYVQYEIEPSDGAWVIKNNYIAPENIDVSVEKNWDLTNYNASIDGDIDLKEIKVRLYQALEGSDDYKVIENEISLNNYNDWKWSSSLPKYIEDANETQYKYKFVELDKNGNELDTGAFTRFNGVDKWQVSYETSGANNETWRVNNTYIAPERVNVSVEKHWDDEEETYRRPDKLKVQLYVQEKDHEGNLSEPKKYTPNGVIELTPDKEWKYTWENLLKKTNDDRELEYVYTVKEMSVNTVLDEDDIMWVNGTHKYQVHYESAGYQNDIYNTFIAPEKTDVKVTKVWNGDDERLKDRPESIEVQLYRTEAGSNRHETYGDKVTLNEANGWTYTWNDLFVKTHDDRETLYTYSVKEVFNGVELEEGTKVRFNGVDKYEVSYGSNSDYDLTITNRWIEPPIRRLKVVKIWVNSTEDAKPDSLNMHLYQIDADKNEILYKDDIVLSKENGWRVEFDVPAQDLQDRDYDYRIAEVVNDKELIENEQIRFNGFDKFKVNYLRGIIDTWELIAQNTFIPRATVDVSVVKEWVDNSEDTRPESVTVELLRDGKRFTQEGINTRVELNADNNWSATWNGLYEAEISPDLNDIGYKYSVVEMYNDRDLEVDDVVRLDGYNKYKVYYSSDVSGKNWTVRNSFVDPTMKKIVVDKVWDGGNDTTRSESISVRLYRDEEVIETVELNESNNWHHEWSVEAERTDDTLYNYRVAEVLDGVDLKDDDIVKFNGRSKYKVSYKVTKTEVVEETERQDGKLTNDTYIITNIYQAPPTKSISVEKIWDEKDRELGEGEVVKHEDITVNLYRNEVLYDTVVLNESNGYKHDWTEAIHAEDENDTPYIYRIAEVFNGKDLSAGDKVRLNGVDKYEVGYGSEVDTEKGKYTITNKYLKPIMKDISIEKKWDKDDESKRPSEIIVNLYQDSNLLETISLNKDNGWKVTRNVMVERNDDSLYEYHVKEVFKGKELGSGDRVKFNGVDKYEVAYTSNDVTSDNFVITNSFIEPNRRDINVQKLWEDNTASTRPDSIKVRLYKDDEIFDTVDLNSENDWKYEWEGLLVNRNDENETEFDYSIKEVFVKDGKEIELEDGDIVRLNGVDKYETNYSKRDADHFVITNKFVEPTMKDASVEKVWIDNGSSTRPDGIEVGLYQDNRLINRVTLNESNNWKHTWSVQVERNDDSLYEYDISELFNDEAVVEGTLIRFNGVDKYLVSYEDNEENRDEHKIINRFIEPDMTSVRVEKTWSEQSSNNRPSSIKVHLYQDSNIFDTVELNNENGWTTTWVVPVNRRDDSVYEYTVKEVFEDRDLVEGEVVKFGRGEYKVSYTVIGENNFRITNTQQNTYTPPSGGGDGGGGERITPPDTVPDKARNPVNDIHVNKPLIALYNIMDNMVPMTQKTEEISDNETPLFGLPGTGDKTNLGKYMLLCFISALGLLGLAFKNKKEEED